MGTPYPTVNPGRYFGDSELRLVQPPTWLDAVIGDEVKKLALFAFRNGYQMGWENSAGQYLDEKDVSKTVGYILTTKGVSEEEVKAIQNCVRGCLPGYLGGEK